MALSSELKSEMLDIIRKVMIEHSPPLVIKKDSKEGIEAIGNTTVLYGSKKQEVPGMYFASAVIRKDNVSFYFFPCYTDHEKFHGIAPSIMKFLDGKSCFHFKHKDELPAAELQQLVEAGISCYKKQGWIK